MGVVCGCGVCSCGCGVCSCGVVCACGGCGGVLVSCVRACGVCLLCVGVVVCGWCGGGDPIAIAVLFRCVKFETGNKTNKKGKETFECENVLRCSNKHDIKTL